MLSWGPNPVDEQVGERWQRLWSHREELLKVARRRSASIEDAEDAVHEAMLRAAEHADLDDARLGGWLTTVTMRLCADRHRQVRRDVAVHSRTAVAPSAPVPVDEVVCDRAEAEWLADRSKELPARQAKALRLKSDGRDVDQIAREMGLSYEATESLLARARRALRRSLAATMAAGLGLWARGRDLASGGVQAAAAASAASAAAVAVLVVAGSHPQDQQAPVPGPVTSAPYDSAAPAAPHRGTDRNTPYVGKRPAAASRRAGAPTGAAAHRPAPTDSAPGEVAAVMPHVPELVPAAPSLPAAPAIPAAPGPSFPPVPSVALLPVPTPTVSGTLPAVPSVLLPGN
jgi:RNA polymerase sigma factor (sigma-70 family)